MAETIKAETLKPISGYTLEMMAEALGVNKSTVKQRLFVAEEHPITTKAIWSKKSFEKIKNVTMGRPKGRRKKSIPRKDGN